MGNLIDCIEVSQNNIRVTLKSSDEAPGPHVSAAEAKASALLHANRHVDIPWRPNLKGPLARIDESATCDNQPDPALVQAITRANSWIKLLMDGEHASIESLAVSVNMHPKVVRKGIRLAFLAPEITEAIVLGHHPKSLNLTDLHHTTSLSWNEQRRRLRIGEWGANVSTRVPHLANA